MKSPDANCLQIDAFLDAVASRTPTPGGGSVAAACGALAGVLARMVAAYSPGRDADDEARLEVKRLAEELARADGVLRELIVEDSSAYEALRRATSSGDRASTQESDVEVARQMAISVPMAIAATCGGILDIGQALLPVVNRQMRSDLAAASALAEAAVRAASYMVYVNARSIDDPERRRKTEREIERVVARAAETYRHICHSLHDVA